VAEIVVFTSSVLLRIGSTSLQDYELALSGATLICQHEWPDAGCCRVWQAALRRKDGAELAHLVALVLIDILGHVCICLLAKGEVAPVTLSML